MEQLTFSPSTAQFFLWTKPEPLPGLRSELGRRLDAAGWPSPARIVRAGGPAGSLEAGPGTIAGTLIETIDALPILAGLPVGEMVPPALAVWARVARLALDLVVRGQIAPQIRCRRGSQDERIVGWQARWPVVLRTPRERADVLQLARMVGTPEIAVPEGRAARPDARVAGPLAPDGRRAPSALGLVRRVMDACADVLVREAMRRGAVVRLGAIPGDAWEQRLVRALADERGTFAAPEDRDPAVLAEELSGWVADQVEAPTLLPSPPSWTAGETLERVLQRMRRPAALLGERLLLGEPAPRTLHQPLTAPVDRLQQSIAVTRTLLQLTGGRVAAQEGRIRKAG